MNLNPKTTVTNFNPTLTKKQITIQTKNRKMVLSVEVAKTQTELTKGLSNRKNLDQDSGMYFELGKRESTTFWMKEMLFPIDIIWIDNGKIVKIDKDAPIPAASKQIPTFSSGFLVTNVLEVTAGFSEKNHVEIDDMIAISD